MVAITLSAEQVRAAPAEVRRWLEQELAASLGLRMPEPPIAQRTSPHLVACSVEQAAAVLSLIQGMLPAVNVFFELGREGASIGIQGLEAFRISDIVRHTRLQTVAQVVACLDAINEAVRQVTGDADAIFYGLDGRDYCFIPEQTQRSILRIWQQIVAERDLRASAPGLSRPNAPSTGPSASSMSPFPASFANAPVSAPPVGDPGMADASP